MEEERAEKKSAAVTSIIFKYVLHYTTYIERCHVMTLCESVCEMWCKCTESYGDTAWTNHIDTNYNMRQEKVKNHGQPAALLTSKR